MPSRYDSLQPRNMRRADDIQIPIETVDIYFSDAESWLQEHYPEPGTIPEPFELPDEFATNKVMTDTFWAALARRRAVDERELNEARQRRVEITTTEGTTFCIATGTETDNLIRGITANGEPTMIQLTDVEGATITFNWRHVINFVVHEITE